MRLTRSFPMESPGSGSVAFSELPGFLRDLPEHSPGASRYPEELTLEPVYISELPPKSLSLSPVTGLNWGTSVEGPDATGAVAGGGQVVSAVDGALQDPDILPEAA